jgi:hypothetical protein
MLSFTLLQIVDSRVKAICGVKSSDNHLTTFGSSIHSPHSNHIRHSQEKSSENNLILLLLMYYNDLRLNLTDPGQVIIVVITSEDWKEDFQTLYN